MAVADKVSTVLTWSLQLRYGRYASLKTRYDEIMAYWKQQKRRGYITPEEYQQLAEEFIGARPVKNKEDETNGKDP